MNGHANQSCKMSLVIVHQKTAKKIIETDRLSILKMEAHNLITYRTTLVP